MVRLKDGRPTGGGDGGGGADGDDGDGKSVCRDDGAGGVDDAGAEQEVAEEVSKRPAGGVASRPAGGADGHQCNRTELGDGLADGNWDSETCDADAGLHRYSLHLLHWHSCTVEAADRDCRGCLGREPPRPLQLRPLQQPSTTNSTEAAG